MAFSAILLYFAREKRLKIVIITPKTTEIAARDVLAFKSIVTVIAPNTKTAPRAVSKLAFSENFYTIINIIGVYFNILIETYTKKL